MLILHKNDVQNALNLTELPDSVIEANATELVEWLQDMNWQVAPFVASRLAGKPSLAEDVLNAALKSDDEMWIYWILESVLIPADSIPDSTYRVVREVHRSNPVPDVAEACSRLLNADSAPRQGL